MVDLVKIRKKAKDRKGSAGEAPETDPPQKSASSPAEPPIPQPAAAPPAPAHGPASPPAEAAPTAEPPMAAETPSPATDSKLEKFKREAGRRRESDSGGQAAAGKDLLELLTFNIAGEQYAVEIEHILEIVAPRITTRVPNADPSVVGIVSLRGTVVTLVDVRRKLRHAVAAAGGPDARIVVVEYGGETLGFLVDRVLRVVKVDPATIEPQPVVHSSEQDDSVRGVFRIANALTILLDLDKLLDGGSKAAVVA